MCTGALFYTDIEVSSNACVLKPQLPLHMEHAVLHVEHALKGMEPVLSIDPF